MDGKVGTLTWDDCKNCTRFGEHGCLTEIEEDDNTYTVEEGYVHCDNFESPQSENDEIVLRIPIDKVNQIQYALNHVQETGDEHIDGVLSTLIDVLDEEMRGYIKTKSKESLEHGESTVELLQCNECGAREWKILAPYSKITHWGDGCLHCDNGKYNVFELKHSITNGETTQ